ncbi:aldo/keto reductase [Niveibacterium microcysteis]|uniref:Aldo/keto reductase n=1 Tax=Niveibacterium microcysteis TaxID=2811415 RepID=A0ABX7M7R6_9RHOO|nr:aldo/keto reductase [Niveibacterium microcysteis]QSI77193.1 aldo/keto reductase [Niveibacterium microcysteis]
MIPCRRYGQSDIEVSALGLGAGQIGDARLDEASVGKLLNAAVDAGITLIDTARGYGLSEERIGRHLARRRSEIVLSTKLGYGIDGFADWTGPCITAGVEAALQRLQTDRIDIVHLHSCPAETLARGEVIDALEAAKQAGKVRAVAYSGENADLDYAVDCGRFDGFMASLNLCDQRVIDRVLPRITGKGFIAKRPSANHPWRFAERPLGDYCEEYWLRWRAMAVSNLGHAWGEIAIRFATSVPGVSSAIVGTANAANLAQNIEWFGLGPLPDYQIGNLRAAFLQHDHDWIGQI